MRLSEVITFWVASCLMLPSNAYAAVEAAKPKTDLLINKSESKVGSVSIDVSLLRGPGEGVQFSAMDSAQKRALSVTATATPVNLRILVDTSVLCHLLKIDEQANGILNLVKRNFAKESLVSIVAFNSNGYEVYENQRKLDDWKGTALTCKGTALASSYEKALITTLEKTNSSLPNVVWVLTSGNVTLSRESALLLKQKGVTLHLLLHNPILEREIRPLVEQTAAIVGLDRVHFSTVPAGSPIAIPEQRFQLTVSTGGPLTNASDQSLVQVTASYGGQTLASEKIAVELAKDPWSKFVAWLLLLGGAALLLGCLVYLMVTIIRYYRPRYCGGCEKRLRFSDSSCLFCQPGEAAYLVGNFGWRDRRKLGHRDVIRISRAETEIGTHRKSVMPLIAPTGKRRERLATIIREGEAAYRLERANGNSGVRVNGHLVKDSRNLASGDVIEIGGSKIIFSVEATVRTQTTRSTYNV